MAVLRMDLDGQSAPEPRPPSNSSDSSEGDQRGPSPDSTFDLADEAGVEQQLNAGHPKCTFWLESQPVFLWLQAFGSDCFRMYDFKVKRCPRARPHDWTCCPFAHPGEKAKRRDPRRYRYSGTACPDFRKNGTCRRGDACPFAHGVFECWLHPSRYRTQICTDGTSCKRRVCFFAHTDAQLRKPEEDSVLLSQQLQAELAAEAQIHQQQQLVQTLTALLTTQGQNLLGGAPGLPNEVLQTLARQSLSGDLQAQAATSNATLQDRARLLQLQLQLNQIQQQQQQVLQGQKHQGGGAMPATALDALQDQVLHARDVIMQQQLQQQVDTELQAGAEDQAQRSLEALRLLKGVGGRGLSPNGRASVTSPFMAQQPVQGAGHLPLMPDMSRQLLGRERVCQAQEAPRRFSLDSQPMPHGQYHRAGSLAVPAPGYGPSRPVVDMEQLGNDLAALLQGRAVLNSGSSARSSLDGPAPQYGSGHHRGSFDGRPSQGVDAGFLGQPSHNQRRSVDLGALSRQFGGNPVGSKMLPMTPTHGGGGMGASGMVHRAGSGALQSIGEGRAASPHSLHRAVSGNLQSVAMPMHGQFVAGSSGHEVLTPEGQLRLQAMQQLLAQQAQRTQHQHGKPIGRYSADGGLTSSGHQTMSRAMMENVGMHSKAACPSPSSGASLIRNASFDRILLELPRSVSDVALGDQHLARATLVGNRSNE